jgi:hypothetical protein
MIRKTTKEKVPIQGQGSGQETTDYDHQKIKKATHKEGQEAYDKTLTRTTRKTRASTEFSKNSKIQVKMQQGSDLGQCIASVKQEYIDK